MSTYVSPLAPGGPVKESCQLTADTIEELQAMGRALGLKTEWLQVHRTPASYTITATKRALAIERGAIERK